MTARTWAIVVVVVLVVGAGAFSAGRFTAPESTKTVEVEKVVFKDRVVEKVVTVVEQAKAETRVVYRDRVVTKEGEVRERIVERTATREESHGETNGETVTEREARGDSETRVEVTVRPVWRVSAQVGASLREPLLPIAGPLVVGLGVDYRIAGGVSAGLWANSVGAAGLSLSLEF